MHVAAADALLDAEPLGPIEMFDEIDPAAAAAAAAHWLRAAVDVTARMTGRRTTTTSALTPADPRTTSWTISWMASGGCRWLFGECDLGLDEGDLDEEALEDLRDDTFKLFVGTEAFEHRKRLL